MLAQTLPLLTLPSRTHLLLAGVALCLVTLLVAVGRLLALGKRRPPPPVEERPTYDPFMTGSPLEKRSSVRRQGSLVEVLVTDAGHAARPVRGWIHDRSMGGVCLMLERSLTLSTVLNVRAANAPQSTPWVQVTVRNYRRWGRDWMHGCQFIKTPQSSVLLTFG
jgi:hypothetical protein